MFSVSRIHRRAAEFAERFSSEGSTAFGLGFNSETDSSALSAFSAVNKYPWGQVLPQGIPRHRIEMHDRQA
jgi:hypothetical protein